MRTAVVMPTRGLPGWDRHLASLLAQTRPADEIVVVIDRATEPAEEGQMAADRPQVRFVFNRENIGVTASLNRGLRATDADIVFRTDDDDESLPDRFARQIACFGATGADFVASWAEGVSDGDTARSYTIRCPTDDAGIKSGLKRRNVLVHSTIAFRRERILALGGYDETFVNAQDYALYLAGMRAGYGFAAVPSPLLRRHYATDNITVKRRYHQLMSSCAARVTHHAAIGDRKGFILTIGHYAWLAATPMWARAARRSLFKLIGRGA